MIDVIRAAIFVGIALLCYTASAAPLVTFESPCECLENHGKQRWAECCGRPSAVPTSSFQNDFTIQPRSKGRPCQRQLSFISLGGCHVAVLDLD